MTAGIPCGVVDDLKHDIDSTTSLICLRPKGITWKAYIENLPADKTKHARDRTSKHNPFVSFNNIRTNPIRLARIVDASEFTTDVANDTLPQIPGTRRTLRTTATRPRYISSPGTPLETWSFLARFLQGFLEPLLLKPAFTRGTLIAITFDGVSPADNHIYTYSSAT